MSNIIGLLCLDKVLRPENERKKIKIEKVDEVKEAVKLEMFDRNQRDGLDCFGNEVE